MTGAVAVKDTGIGSFDAPMTICESGAREYFLGVDVGSADQQVVMRIVENPNPGQGPTLTLVNAATPGEGLQLSRDNCSTLDVLVQPTNTLINGVRVMRGHARFDCALHSGGMVRGDLDFSNCH